MNKSKRGGKRPGAGRPKTLPEKRREPLTIRLPNKLKSKIDEFGPEKGKVLEIALTEYFERN